MGDWLTNPGLKYSDHISPSQEALNKIRRSKYIQPENTGENHPQNIYFIFAHGNEDTSSKNVVPKGCVLVVKSHSGDATNRADFVNNIFHLTSNKNKEIAFDPVGHKKELFTILTADDEASKLDITASSSSAIYREGDTYNDFSYTLLLNLDTIDGTSTSIMPSGLFKRNIQNNSDSIYLEEIKFVNYNTPIFIKDKKNYKYNADIISLVYSCYLRSIGYDYYYTIRYFLDILDIILIYINILNNGFVLRVDVEKKLEIMMGMKYININNRIQKTTKESLLSKFIEGALTEKDESFLKLLRSGSAPDHVKISPMIGITFKGFVHFIKIISRINQSQIFKDIEDGLLQPGVFYNLSCRATENTLISKTISSLSNKKRKLGLLNTKYIENSNHSIPVHEESKEVKNRISEAILQRKDQAREVFGNRTNTGKKYKRIHNNNVIRWVENNTPQSASRRRKNRKTRKNKK